MYTYTINISEATVLKAVRMLSNYTGDRFRGDGTAYDRIALEPEQNEVLEPMLQGAMSEVLKTLKQYVTACTVSGYDYEITLSLPAEHNANTDAGLTTAIERYCEYAILAGWYDMTDRNDSEATRAKAVAYLERIKSLAFFRNRPTWTSPTPDDAPWKEVVIEGQDSTDTTDSTTDASSTTEDTDGTATESTNTDTTSEEEETA